jgi:dephospho-CoA kinase
MFTVGVTGGIGSGKSTVCRVFAVLGVPVFHSDEQGRRLLEEDAGVRSAVAETFGPQVMAYGAVDRQALAAVVFQDPQALARLNAIVHPAVRMAFEAWCRQQDAPYVMNEAAILVETGAWKRFDRLLTVEAPEAVRVARVVARDGATRDQVLGRMRNQAEESRRTAVAHAVLVNDGERMVLPQVLDLHHRFLMEAQAP